MMKPKTIYRKDYRPPPFLVESIDLCFDLGEAYTDVRAQLRVRRAAHAASDSPLQLQGRDLQLLSLKIDAESVPQAHYTEDEHSLTLRSVPDECVLDIVTRIEPQNNTSLEGLYQSAGNFCTQCEAEGFRKITYYLDRPDVMAVFTTTLRADKTRYPVLLSNGNLVASGDLDDGRHWARWHDPFKKPSYLFALVAGQFAFLEDRFITRSAREVLLRIYAEPQNIDQCEHAMQSLKKAMAWDERVFGLEYDLDIYMIVAVGDFNMGAMENKGLNIFNTRYVLARPDTATDSDYQGVEAVIAHEYFHNWTGNRVTCRDWFQLSLKEGLTVFRDQEFSADMGSRGVKRIDDVRILRSVQFPQDSGPMAHPVRPDAYMEINNFYTVTVYNKGAEVIRMMRNLLGENGFRQGMDLYFQRHDGEAVTCDDFVAAMEDANGADLAQFRLWYSQAGTPQLNVGAEYDAQNRRYTLTIEQSCPPTPGQARKKPFHIPLAVGLIGTDGNDLPLQLEGENAVSDGTTRVLELRSEKQQFCFVNVMAQPVPSLLRGFSAPVKLFYDYSDDDLMFLLARDSDDFNRWEAGQQLASRMILGLLAQTDEPARWYLPPAFAQAFSRALADPGVDPALLARLLTLPSENELADSMTVADVDGIHAARDFTKNFLAQTLREQLLAVYQRHHGDDGYSTDGAVIGRRSLKNRCLDYLLTLDEPKMREIAMAQFNGAANMTDQLGALSALGQRDCAERKAALASFYRQWRAEPLVIDKWLTLQAVSPLPGTLQEVKGLLRHEAFNIKNPNKVRALIGAFCQANPYHFHASDGTAYAFLREQVIALNKLNPQVAARLVSALTQWRKYDRQRQDLMRRELQHILDLDGLSPDVFEIAAKSLGDSV